MPNHVKNRIRLEGDEAEITRFIERYSTHYPATQKTSFDDELVFSEGDEYGWLNQSTGVFHRRDIEDVMGVPEGFTPSMEDAWIRFPDFSKVIPMPESLSITSSSSGDTGLAIIEGVSANRFLNLDDNMERFYRLPMKDRIEAIELGLKYAKNKMLYGHKDWYSWSVEYWGTKWNAYDCRKVNDNTFEFDTAWSNVAKLVERMSLEFPEITIYYDWADEDTGRNCGNSVYRNGIFSEEVPQGGSKRAYEIAFSLRPDYAKNYTLVNDAYEYVE